MTINTEIHYSLVFILLAFNAWAQNIPPKPNPPRLVNDYTNTLSDYEIRKLENKLVTFYDTTSNQIAVVFVNSLDGYEPYSYAQLIGQKWGVGGSKFNNGLLFLLNPKLLQVADKHL